MLSDIVFEELTEWIKEVEKGYEREMARLSQ